MLIFKQLRRETSIEITETHFILFLKKEFETVFSAQRKQINQLVSFSLKQRERGFFVCHRKYTATYK